METICIIIVSIWLIGKFLGSGSSNKKSNGLSSVEKYKTFESLRKK